MTAANSSTPETWIIDEVGRVSIDDGVRRWTPTSVDIWQAQFEPVLSDLTRPSNDITNLKFSPSLLSFDVAVERSPLGHPILVLSPPNQLSSEVIVDWPQHDQIVISETWFALDVHQVDQIKAMLDEQGIALNSPLTTPQLMWLYWASGFDIRPLPESDATPAIQTISGSFRPDLVRASLYPYQVEGARFLGSMADQGLGCVLADEMGLGKTLQALYLLVRESGHGTALVVCPAALVTNWTREISKFAPQMSFTIHGGPSRRGDPGYFEDFNIIITSYDVLNRDVEMMDSFDWSVIVLDEAQAIKNPSARRSISAKRLTSRVKVAVTGTPIENSLTDLWSILEFVAPTYLGTLQDFQRTFPDEPTAALELSRRVAPLTLRRLVKDVASDLPPRIDIATPIDAGSAFAEAYEQIRSHKREDRLAQLTRLRQFCAAPVGPGWLGSLDEFSKYQVALEILNEAFSSGEKALIFASYLDSLDLIASDLTSKYPSVFLRSLDGRVSAELRQRYIDEFSENTGPAVLVLNPRAAGVGLNIQAATRVIHFTPEWNPALVAQATARAYRRGQDRPVFVHYLYVADTVEEVMIDRLDAKRELQDAGLSETARDLTEDELVQALSRTPAKGPHVS